MNLKQRLIRWAFGEPPVNDTTFTIGQPWNRSQFDDDPLSRDEHFAQALMAWKVNPIARRIVQLYTQYIIGTGLSLYSFDDSTLTFLKKCWNHPLNDFDSRVLDWSDELARAGNLFMLMSTDSSGMTYFRAVPATNIDRIETASNDIQQPKFFHRKPSEDVIDPEPFVAYDFFNDAKNEDGTYPVRMIQFTINRPIGGLWGEGDLSPMLKWLSRYSAWLEDRARLNRYRNSFMFVVKGFFQSEAERVARQHALNASPPTPGSILVAGEGEEWSVIAPQLGSADASLDGLGLKKMISVGAGIPLHFLSEPESATRTTAEASNGPTFRGFAQRQRGFLKMLESLLSIALHRRAMVDTSIDDEAAFSVTGPDVSPRDNLSMSQSAKYAMEAFYPLFEQELITSEELLRMVYRFSGEAGTSGTDGE